MKPESRRALMELISFGMEEISSEDAAPLLAQIHECSECAGQWVLIHRTIDTLSHVGETEISSQRAQQMWLVCMEHAKHKDNGVHGEYEGYVSALESHEDAHHHEEKSGEHASGAERLVKHLEEMRTPLAFLVPQLGFAFASSAALMLLHV